MPPTPDTNGPRLEAAHPFRLRLALASFAAGGAVLLAVVAGLTRQADATLLDDLRLSPQQPAWLLEAVRDLTALGSFTVLGLAVLATTGFLLAKGRAGLAVQFLASALGATAFSSLLKLAVDRARPDAVEALAATFTRSFPSGHALLTAAIVLTIGGFLTLTVREPAARKMVWAVAGTTALLVGLSRLFLGVHWPSDVLAGWFFGLGWALLTLNWTARSWPRQQG
ncbi:MAG: phosphatase PAP2 family protein [Proteobacteria bacterium]|nr:phosphatase PAP2 family protein [Pseudomonadota bacterium]